MSIARILLRLLVILACAVLAAVAGAIAGVRQQANQITEKSSEYISIAKIWTNLGAISGKAEKDERPPEYVSITEALEGQEMYSRALERVKVLNPDFPRVPVSIRIPQTKDIGVINLVATGSDPRYTRALLNALLDEFVASRHEMRESIQGEALRQVLEAAADRQKEMKQAQAALKAAPTDVESLAATSDHARLLARLKAQQTQRDELRLQLKPLAENDAARVPLRDRISALEAEIKDIMAAIQRHESTIADLRNLREKAIASKSAFDKAFAKADELQSSIDHDDVYIQERASPAFEQVMDWKRPVALWALGAGLVGGILGIAMSGALVPAPRPQVPAAA
ncbi:hypothetical protein [Prosthecobacter sp.]|uniref:hypothetical protein n=1 Tax=Prosthecobacter sp. TaxID=1965333 RepID=UPI003784586B